MDNAVDRHVFYISDGTAITAEVLGHAVMSVSYTHLDVYKRQVLLVILASGHLSIHASKAAN